MLFQCIHIRNIWNRLSDIINVNIKWKHIVAGFYNYENESVNVLNCLIDIVAYAIFKENMHGKYSGK